MNRAALKLWEHLTQTATQREERLLDFLKNPLAEGTPEWAFWVPQCFHDAMDIRQTLRMENGTPVLRWTQGGNFAFKTGDIFYDTPDAYGDWLKALKTLGICVQVCGASDAIAAQSSRPRNSGSIHFDLYVPNEDKTRLVHKGSHRTSQDAFVRYLISGEGLQD